jgi:hypothetical protein
MRGELEQKLVERWPSWFTVTGDQRETRMADGFAHGDGWFNIVWRLCEDLEPLVAEAEKATGHPFEAGHQFSEPALPSLMSKLEKLGCSQALVGLVVPTGYIQRRRHQSLHDACGTLRGLGH